VRERALLTWLFGGMLSRDFVIDKYLVGQALSNFATGVRMSQLYWDWMQKKTKVFQNTEENLIETELQFTQFQLFTSETLYRIFR
jgi:hypothetical protein